MTAPVLRPDQEQWLGGIRQAFQQGARAVLGQAPTGFGKNTCAAHCLAKVAARAGRAAFVVHREEISIDLVARLKAAGVPSVRLLMGGHGEGDAHAAVTVLSVQTFGARDLQLEGIDVAWVDEAHRSAAPSYQHFKERHPRARYVGASATPARADGRPLRFFDAIVPGPQVQEMVAAGNLAPLTVYAPDQAAETLAQDPVETYPAGKAGIVFGHSLSHSKAIAAGLQGRGLKAAHVEAGTKGRDGIIESFNTGSLDVLCCYRLLTEGIDVPRASVCMLATRMQSVVAFLQSIGRVRRPTGGHAVLFDLMGSFWLHGHPDADRRYSLEGAQGIGLAAAKDAMPCCSQCANCLSWGPASAVCDGCGFARPAPKPPKLTKKELKEQRMAAVPRTGPDFELWSNLVATSKERGWKPQAAAIRFRQLTNRWPRWTAAAALSEGSEMKAAANE